jgi:ABC-type transport system involved in cytochrome c biogenesis ATPase subunit
MTDNADPDIMIEADGLSKYYGDFIAVENLNFTIRKGEVVAFLGPNGAGKSTTMKMLTGYLAPSSGSAKVCGLEVAGNRNAVANRIGYLPENGPLYDEMTPLSLLKFFGEARGMESTRILERIDSVVEQCSLETVLNKPIGKLSRGYRQRVGMANVLLHESGSRGSKNDQGLGQNDSSFHSYPSRSSQSCRSDHPDQPRKVDFRGNSGRASGAGIVGFLVQPQDNDRRVRPSKTVRSISILAGHNER